MKLTAAFILVACLHVSARSTAQTVSISGKNISLEKVFTEIKKQTGYLFLYNVQMLQKAKPVDINVKMATVDEVLNLCFRDQPLTYVIEGNTIIVKPKLSPPLDKGGQGGFDNSPLTIDISGKVTDQDGNPLAGASVKVKGTTQGTTTNADGVFVLKGVNENATLEISFVGYGTITVGVNSKNAVEVILKKNISPLDEIQVIAYGRVSKRLNPGNVTTVKGEDIAKQPVNNPLLALEGRVPGLFITQTTGLAGGAVTVRLQGQNSIFNGNDPLYVIDGVPFTMQLLTTTLGGPLGSSGALSNGVALQGNPLSYIDPSSIESIEILKDADATAIYGSRAANGAILITTKKGKVGELKSNITLLQGWGRITRNVQLLNTQQYLQMRHEAFYNDNASIRTTDYDINGFWDTTKYTNWQKVFLGNTAHYTDIRGDISGGTSLLQYSIGTTYHYETTVFPTSPTKFNDEKGSMHISLNSGSPSDRFKIQFSASYLIDNNLLPQTDLTRRALNLVPDAPSLYNQDGSLNWMPNSTGTSTWYNPLADLYNTYENKTQNLISDLTLGYKILSGLELKGNLGYTDLLTKEFSASPLIAFKPEQRTSSVRSATYSNSEIKSWIIEPQLVYKKSINKSKLEVLAGTTFQENNNSGQAIYAAGFASDAVLKNIVAATTTTPIRTDISVYKYCAAFGRLNYNLKEKYLLDLTARRDGSTRFGPANKFHNFGSAALAWIFSEEKLVKNNLQFLSFGKIRASYGTTGSDQIGDYTFMNLYTPIGGVAVPYQGGASLTINGLFNPFLQWEETKKIQFGIDLSFFADRVLLTANFVHNRSSNQLLGYSLPITSGFFTISKNFPATVQNTSLEISLSTTNIQRKNFKWSSNFNLTVPKNKLISFPNLAASSYNSSLVIGQPITILKLYHQIGVNDTTGVYQFADSKGNPTYNPSFTTDRNVIINRAPKYYGGLENTITFKSFQLDFLLQFVKQLGALFLNNSIPGVYTAGSINGYNQPVYVLQRWQKPGDVTNIERFVHDFRYSSAFSYSAGSDAVWGDASYIRLKNVSLSWQLPDELFKRIHVSNFSILIRGENLLTITKYKGMDPENQGTGAMALPPLRILTMGFKVGF